MSAPEKKTKKKDNYLEIEFQLGDLKFAARGKTLNVERNFKMLIDLVEDGKLNMSMTDHLWIARRSWTLPPLGNR